MTRPLASLIVPSYRGANRLPGLFNSLAAQAPGCPEIEVLVVIDGIVDDSPRLVAAEDRFSVRAIEFPTNRGRVAALNAGYSAARGEVLIRCDDDLLPGPDFVRDHIRAHDRREGGVIGLTRNVFPPTRFAEVYGNKADIRHRGSALTAPAGRTWRHWAGNCSLPRDIWDAVGPYDSAYRRYGWEDVDYGYRIHRAGFPITIRPELEIPHRAAADSAEARVLRAFQAAAARTIFEAKFGAEPFGSGPTTRSLWTSLVDAAAPIIGRSPARAGRIADRLIPGLPARMGEKLIALTVESAAAAGYRHPDTAKETF